MPPIDSLSFDSDFTAFLQPNVDESLKRQALRKLFTDPRFNVMDGLDVYIDDYSKFEPISPELVAQLNHAKFLFDPPKTRVNEHGHVEDVPDEQVAEAGRRIGRGSARYGSRAGAIVDKATNPPLADAAVPPMTLPVPPVSEQTLMTLETKALYLCSCNGTAPIDAAGVAGALGLAQAPVVHTMLCQKELAAFAEGAAGDVIVGCTQEARLFDEIAGEAAKTQAIRFVNLREAEAGRRKHAAPRRSSPRCSRRPRCPIPIRCRACRIARRDRC